MYNIAFSLNIVLPMVILAGVGLCFRYIGFITKPFLASANKIIFYIGIPSNIFMSILLVDIGYALDIHLITFYVGFVLFSYSAIWGLSAIWLKRRKPLISAMVNGSYRGNLAIVGLPLIISVLPAIYAARAALVVAIIIPIYNVLTVVVLQKYQEKPSNAKKQTPLSFITSLFMIILKNPPAIGAICGLLVSISGLPLPMFIHGSIQSLAALSTPLALIVMGAALSVRLNDSRLKYAVLSVVIKVVILPIAAVALAYVFGLRGYYLVIVGVLSGVPSAVGGYVQVVELGGDAFIAANNVALTTVMSALSLTIFLFIFRLVGLI